MVTSPSGEPPRVVVDANVFFVPPVREILFYGAARAEPILALCWSEAILTEVARNWARVTGPTRAEERWHHFARQFRLAFVDGLVGTTAPVSPPTRIAPEDRHVVGTALAGAATGIVTYNLRDFPRAELAARGLRVWHPDQLLCELLAARPEALLATLREQGRSLRTPRSLPQVLTALAGECPRFVARVRAVLNPE